MIFFFFFKHAIRFTETQCQLHEIIVLCLEDSLIEHIVETISKSKCIDIW